MQLSDYRNAVAEELASKPATGHEPQPLPQMHVFLICDGYKGIMHPSTMKYIAEMFGMQCRSVSANQSFCRNETGVNSHWRTVGCMCWACVLGADVARRCGNNACLKARLHVR